MDGKGHDNGHNTFTAAHHRLRCIVRTRHAALGLRRPNSSRQRQHNQFTNRAQRAAEWGTVHVVLSAAHGLFLPRVQPTRSHRPTDVRQLARHPRRHRAAEHLARRRRDARSQDDPSETPLLAADGTPLGITLGQWESAAGTVSLTCDGSQDTAAHELRGLIPGGLYSVFVVHLNIQGSGRFTPFGDPAGTANNFTASADGTASPTTTVNGCLTNQEAVVIIWHSDHQAHGASAGTIGVDWHNALITRVT